jgi:hypothetical protein
MFHFVNIIKHWKFTNLMLLLYALILCKQNGTLHAFYKHLENKINHCFFYILFMHVMLYYKALFVWFLCLCLNFVLIDDYAFVYLFLIIQNGYAYRFSDISICQKNHTKRCFFYILFLHVMLYYKVLFVWYFWQIDISQNRYA